MILDWVSVTLQALQHLWQAFLSFMPILLGAIIVFVIGWFIAVGIGKIVTEILKKVKFNQIFEKGNWDEALAKADIKVDASGFIGAIVKWVLVIVFLLAAVDILGFVQFAGFLSSVLGYLPNVILAALTALALLAVFPTLRIFMVTLRNNEMRTKLKSNLIVNLIELYLFQLSEKYSRIPMPMSLNITSATKM